MITLTWGHLMNKDFIMALEKFYRQPMGFDNLQKFVLIGREIKKQQAIRQECHEKLLKQYGEPDPERLGTYKLHKETEREFGLEVKKLFEHEFQILIKPINSKKLSEKADLSPAEWLILEPLFEPFDDGTFGAGDIHDDKKNQKPDEKSANA
jgi:hypothetical protein